jgi:hypothetical protein
LFSGADLGTVKKFINASERSVRIELPPSPETVESKIANRLRTATPNVQIALVGEASGSLDSALAFMRAALELALRDEDIGVNRKAYLSLIYLFTLGTRFVDWFVENRLHEQINFGKRETADYILALYLAVFEVHAEVATPELVAEIAGFAGQYPTKVLRVFEIICRAFTPATIDWQIVDFMIMNWSFYVHRNAGRPVSQVLYSLISNFEAVRAERGEVLIDIFQKCVQCEDVGVVQIGYTALTSLRIPQLTNPDLLRVHLENPRVSGVVLRYLTVADIENADRAVIKFLLDAPEKKLSAAVLWRFAALPHFRACIMAAAEKFATLEAVDLLRLLGILADGDGILAQLAKLPSLAEWLEPVAEATDDIVVDFAAEFVRCLSETAGETPADGLN